MSVVKIILPDGTRVVDGDIIYFASRLGSYKITVDSALERAVNAVKKNVKFLQATVAKATSAPTVPVIASRVRIYKKKEKLAQPEYPKITEREAWLLAQNMPIDLESMAWIQNYSPDERR